MPKHTLTFSTDNDCTRLELMFRELIEMLKRENLRIHSCDSQYEEVLNDVIDKMDEYINCEPSDAELMGEPPLSAAERHSAAWAEHLEAHR